MRSIAGKVLLGASLLGALGSVAALIVGGGGGREAAMADVGRFRLGAALGEERAGFSGRPKLLVFADSDAPGWVALEACLRSAEIEAELGGFTPILVDARDPAEAGVEAEARAAGFAVVIRGLNGAFLGGLSAGGSSRQLLDLLREVRAALPEAPVPSPLCALLRQAPADVIDAVLAAGEREKALRMLDLLKELEGDEAEVVRIAQERIGR